MGHEWKSRQVKNTRSFITLKFWWTVQKLWEGIKFPNIFSLLLQGLLVPESDVCVCMLCLEQESIKDSVMNLITYPWIRDRVKSGEVKIHGCYYNLSDCSLEKWKLSSDKNSNEFYVSDKEIWNWENVQQLSVLTSKCAFVYVNLMQSLLIIKGNFWGSIQRPHQQKNFFQKITRGIKYSFTF